MSFTTEANCISEQTNNIFDLDGRDYYLKTHYFYDSKHQIQSMILKLYRCKINKEVGRASCIFKTPNDILLADILICNHEHFDNSISKLFKINEWSEPSNYQKKQLGSYLLEYVISIAKARNVKRIHGFLTEQDISNNSNLIPWYKRYGFQLESPTDDKVRFAKHRICLYF